MSNTQVPVSPHFRPVSTVAPIAHASIVWAECLHGTVALREALLAIAETTAAEGLVLLRATAAPRRVRILSHFDRSASRGAEPLPQPLGPDLISVSPGRVLPGTIWSLLEAEPSVRLEQRQSRWLESRSIVEVAVIALGSEDGALDMLELHLSHRPTPGQRARLADLAEALSFAWGRRPEGRVARLLSDAPTIARRLGLPAPLAPLSTSNPWRLTPTETRICGMFRDGMTVQDIVGKIGVTESTLRTHLRNIYAKAGVSGQVGLLRCLMEDPAARLV
jgi:DNA-binding CsgD family transcriptional regulator